MSKGIKFSLLSLVSVGLFFFSTLFASAKLDPEALRFGVTVGPAISWDFTGYGVGLNLGYVIEEKHTFELEYLYLDLEATSRTYSRRTARSIFVGDRSDKSKTELDEHFLFFNYRYTDAIPLGNTKRLHYYYGLGLGVRRTFVETTTYTNITVKGRSGRVLRSANPVSSHTEDHTNAAGQVFVGLGFDLSEHISVRLGGRGIFSTAFQPTTDGVIDPVRQGNLNIKSSSFTGMLEAGVTLRW